MLLVSNLAFHMGNLCSSQVWILACLKCTCNLVITAFKKVLCGISAIAVILWVMPYMCLSIRVWSFFRSARMIITAPNKNTPCWPMEPHGFSMGCHGSSMASRHGVFSLGQYCSTFSLILQCHVFGVLESSSSWPGCRISHCHI